MIVWMSTLRRGLPYHLMANDRYTACGRFVGPPEQRRGEMLPLVRAVDDYMSRRCPRCEVKS